MALKRPKSMSELVYYTRRSDDDADVEVWVFKGDCPKCGKGIMGKPKDPKTGKTKIRASEYVCPKCNYSVEKEAYEDSLTANVAYKHKVCGSSDEIQAPFKRKKMRVEISGKKKTKLVFEFACTNCNGLIRVAKLK